MHPGTEADPRIVQFVQGLKLESGQSFTLQDWQRKIFIPLFETKQSDGLRQYRTAFIFLPRKNGKTQMAAAMALYGLCADGEQCAEVYCAAADREQASRVFRAAARMVRSSPALSKVCRVLDSTRRIIYKPTDSMLLAIPADAPGAHGFNASMIIIDELHTQKTRDLYDALITSTGARKQPLVICITTAGHDRYSLCYELYDYACKIRDGIIKDDKRFFQCIYELGEDEDWTDETIWHKCNPALGHHRGIEDMRQLAKEAKEVPAKTNTFLQLYLNRWTNAATRWLPEGAWEACADGNLRIEDFKNKECFIGIDLAYRKDYAAVVALFPVDSKYAIFPFFFLPRDGGRDLRREPTAGFVRSGHVTLTGQHTTDFRTIREKIEQLAREHHVVQIAVDPWNATQLSTELIDEGFDVVEFVQSIKNFNEPTKHLDNLVMAKRIMHDGNPVLRWMVNNVMIETDNSGNYKPSKKESSEKIDGATACIMGLAVAMVHQLTPYEDRGLMLL